jgi:Zn-finger nucleic acid-binding protein
MVAHKFEAIDFEVCESCGGVWFGEGEMHRVLSAGQPATDAAEATEPLEPPVAESNAVHNCPVCALPLHQTKVPGEYLVAAEACYNCGGMFLTTEAMKSLSELEHNPNHEHLAPEVIAYGAELDARGEQDLARAQMYNQLLGTSMHYRGLWGVPRFW